MISAGGGRAPGPAIVWRRSVPWLVLGLLMALSSALIWSWSTHGTLRGDEWGYAARVNALPTWEYLFQPPPGKHLIAIPLLLYKAAFEGFGISSYLPYRLAHITLLLVCAGMFYALARRRVGDVLAVLPTAILLFLGSSVVVAIPLLIPSLIATAAGLAMLLALERRDLKGDLAACCLLALSLASHSTSFAFAAAAAVLVLSRPAPERWRRSWVFALPILAYATWWVLEFDSPGSRSLGSAIVDAPVFIGKSLVATLRATSGLGTDSSYLGLVIPTSVRVVLAAVLLALLVAVVVASVRRARAISAFTLAITAALLAFWISINLAPGPERMPENSKYLYPGALLFLLLLCELGRNLELPRRLTRHAAIAIIALFAVSIAGNLYELRTRMRTLENASDRERAGLTSLALAGSDVPPGFILATALAAPSGGGQAVGLPVAALRRVLDAYGSPAYSAAELSSRPQGVRVTADYVLLRATGSELRPTARLPVPHNPAPLGLWASGGTWAAASHGCIELLPSAPMADGLLSLPTGRLALAADAGPPVAVRAGLFANGAAIPISSLRGGNRTILDLPATDGVHRDWRVAIQAARQRVLACSA